MDERVLPMPTEESMQAWLRAVVTSGLKRRQCDHCRRDVTIGYICGKCERIETTTQEIIEKRVGGRG